jgi:hypothetical protein
MVYPQVDYKDNLSYSKLSATMDSNPLDGYSNMFDTPPSATNEKSVSTWDARTQIFGPFNGSDSEDTGAGTRTRRRPFKNSKDRAQTAQTRRDNACLRCRMQRIRVSIDSLVRIYYIIDDSCSVSRTLLIQKEYVLHARRFRRKRLPDSHVSGTKSPKRDSTALAISAVMYGVTGGETWR